MWKHIVMAGLCAASMAGLSACGTDSQTKAAPAPEIKTEAKAPAENGKTLVVYFSATGHTKKVAEAIAENTQADIYEITPKDPYTAKDLDYNDSKSRVSREHKDRSIRPEIEGNVNDWESYSTIYLGYPLWWGEAPDILYTFVETHDFKGKRSIPFCTSAESGVGDSAELLAEAAKTGDWLGGTRFSAGFDRKDIADWVKRY